MDTSTSWLSAVSLRSRREILGGMVRVDEEDNGRSDDGVNASALLATSKDAVNLIMMRYLLVSSALCERCTREAELNPHRHRCRCR